MNIKTVIILILIIVLAWKMFRSWLLGKTLREIKKIALQDYNWQIDDRTVNKIVKAIFLKKSNP